MRIGSFWDGSGRRPTWLLAGALLSLWLGFAVPAQAAATTQRWDVGQVAPGANLYLSLQEKKLTPDMIRAITRGLKPLLKFSRIPAQTGYTFSIGTNGRLQEFAIEAGSHLLHLSFVPERRAVRRLKVPRQVSVAAVQGEFEGNLMDSIRRTGEAGDLCARFEAALSQGLEAGVQWQRGDSFRLVVEKTHGGRWLLRYGQIEAFEIRSAGLSVLAIRYKGEYYDENGRALKKQFLPIPLNYRYVSSEFMQQRKHPILGGTRPHRGIDLAAPRGAPVWSIADGQVVAAKWLKGYGRTVIVRHAHGYETLYAHLSRFGPGIREGAAVRQKQVLGFIGMTGLTTGPHLHFGLTRDGQIRDPLREDFPRATLVLEEDLQAFEAKKKTITAILNAGSADAAAACPRPPCTPE